MKKELTTLFTGRHSTFLPEINSTNTYLSGLLRTISLPEGSVIRTDYQTAGRGQKSAVWESEAGKNLLLSFLFYPSFVSPKDVFLLNKTFSLGIYDFIEKWLQNSVTIKWPNDIYWKNKKVCGILIENTINASTISHSIIGMGININQRHFSADLINPVSFFQIKNNEYNLEELFNSLCSCLEVRYLQLKNDDIKTIDKDYQSALFSFGEWKNYESAGIRFEGCILGVDENGKLMIETEKGDVRKFDLKEVKYV